MRQRPAGVGHDQLGRGRTPPAGRGGGQRGGRTLRLRQRPGAKRCRRPARPGCSSTVPPRRRLGSRGRSRHGGRALHQRHRDGRRPLPPTSPRSSPPSPPPTAHGVSGATVQVSPLAVEGPAGGAAPRHVDEQPCAHLCAVVLARARRLVDRDQDGRPGVLGGHEAGEAGVVLLLPAGDHVPPESRALYAVPVCHHGVPVDAGVLAGAPARDLSRIWFISSATAGKAWRSAASTGASIPS